MKMQLLEPLRIKFAQPSWANAPELALIDTILEQHPEFIRMFEGDIRAGSKNNSFGRGDVPSVEQLVRAAMYKEIKKLDYRTLEYHQEDSRICAMFVKLEQGRSWSFQVYQKYISKISKARLEELLYAINRIAIETGIEDVSEVCMDSTVLETSIHYPTNNALVWDCIHESHRLLSQLQKEVESLTVRDYTKGAKAAYFLLDNTKKSRKKSGKKEQEALDKRTKLFVKQLVTFTKAINQVARIVKKKAAHSATQNAMAIVAQLEKLLPLMEQVYAVTLRHEVEKEPVENAEKLFSIYEQHTDIIAKDGREVKLGHKVNFASGKSNLVLAVDTLKGNPSDSSLYSGMLDKVIATYNAVPRDSATDGGYASSANLRHAQGKGKGVINIVFNKMVDSLQRVASSKNMETQLKKWRGAIEAIISDIKRGFQLHRCTWKGEEHFHQKVLWSTIAHNIRVMSALLQPADDRAC
ncbi:MAG: ISNCY family transposase [Prevotellaceae bacterium]|jgi:IS5 family transposase|nr:ISNCY family transposase [Prevotellaceae bacterium]